MKEHPILFSGEMVRAILADRKTQTRRVLRLADGYEVDGYSTQGIPTVAYCSRPDTSTGSLPVKCPYGAPGDRLWVRETFAPDYFGHGKPGYRADYNASRIGDVVPEPRWKPSIFMRRHESRITLAVTSVRVEPLQSISEEDARAESVSLGLIPADEDGPRRLGYVLGADDGKCVLYSTAVEAFHAGWDSINGKRAPWASNPWVWVVEFRRCDAAHVAELSVQEGAHDLEGS